MFNCRVSIVLQLLSWDLHFSSTMEATKMTVVVIYAQGWKTDAEEIMFWLVMRNIFCLTVCILVAVTFTKLFQTVQGLWKEICCPSCLLDSDSCNTRDHFLSFLQENTEFFSPIFSCFFTHSHKYLPLWFSPLFSFKCYSRYKFSTSDSVFNFSPFIFLAYSI